MARFRSRVRPLGLLALGLWLTACQAETWISAARRPSTAPVVPSVAAVPALFSGGLLGGGPAVDPTRELLLRDLSVVNDPQRTQGTGAWTFGTLMTAMAGHQDPSDFVLHWLESWEHDQVVNGRPLAARPRIRSLVIDPWLAASGGTRLDLTKAPFRLLAIVNRMDLRHRGNAGEGRFVFGVLGATGRALPFTVIFEYGITPSVSGSGPLGVTSWAQRWHALGAIPLGDPRFNAELEALTASFAKAGAAPERPNGSALNQLRTNEIILGRPWEMREFRLGAQSGQLEPSPVALTPDLSFNGGKQLASYLNEQGGRILTGKQQMPAAMLAPAAPVPNPQPVVWNAPDLRLRQVRHSFALNTCNGCHLAETATPFVHVATRSVDEIAPLSAFMTGSTVRDPVTGEPHAFNDLDRRAKDLAKLLKLGGLVDLDPFPTRVH